MFPRETIVRNGSPHIPFRHASQSSPIFPRTPAFVGHQLACSVCSLNNCVPACKLAIATLKPPNHDPFGNAVRSAWSFSSVVFIADAQQSRFLFCFEQSVDFHFFP